jgi:outer membrane phospholipase A
MKTLPLVLFALIAAGSTAWASSWWRAVADDAGTVLLEELVANDTDRSISTSPATTVPVVVAGDTRARTATLVDKPAPSTIAPGSFVKHVYRLESSDLPANGKTLLVGSIDPVPVVVGASPSTPHLDHDSGHPAGAAPASALASGPAPEAAQPFLPRSLHLGILPHEPIYFSVGTHDTTSARFQLSFKFRPTGPEDPDDDGTFFTDRFYFAFTQTSVWDLESTSKPFRDSSYRPSIFYQKVHAGHFLGADFGIATGVEHESNGKDNLNSRSINIAYATPSLRWTLGEKNRLSLSAKTYYYLEKEENADIADYRGYCDLIVGWERIDSLKIEAKLRKGMKGHYGSVQIDASYPFASLLHYDNFVLRHGYLHLQYFNGWGETILDYNKRLPWQWRVGVMIVR